MNSTKIKALRAIEILDSRGRPTVEAEVELAGGAKGRGIAPSGASTGSSEAWELRDGDPAWHGGRGVSQAVANLNTEIAAALTGRDATDQRGLDQVMRALDGSDRLERLGGNAVLAASLAICRAAAKAMGRPLHEWISELADRAPSLPMPMTNILSGGLHARRGMDVQDFLIMPVGADSYRLGLHWIGAVREAAAELMAERGMPTLLADEGGLSPGFADSRAALDLLVQAIERAGLRPAEDVAIALDIAATSLQDGDRYQLARADAALNSSQMIDMISEWVKEYPILSVEDALGEEDWAGWTQLTRRMGHIQLVGDDLFTTNRTRVERGIEAGAANGVLIKLNQNGTLTGTLEALHLAQDANYATIISARSGETEDDFISHLAVGTGGGQIKIGSVRNSERLSKYNALLRLDDRYHLPYRGAEALSGKRHATAKSV